MVTSLSVFAARNIGRDDGSAMSASAESASARGRSPGFPCSNTLVKSATAPRYLSDPSVVMISLRTRSTLRLSIGRSPSPAEASIFLSAETAWKRTSKSRSCSMATSSSGIADQRAESRPARVAGESCPRSRSCAPGEPSRPRRPPGRPGWTIASGFSSDQGVTEGSPAFPGAEVFVLRGRCRFHQGLNGSNANVRLAVGRGPPSPAARGCLPSPRA